MEEEQFEELHRIGNVTDYRDITMVRTGGRTKYNNGTLYISFNKEFLQKNNIPLGQVRIAVSNKGTLRVTPDEKGQYRLVPRGGRRPNTSQRAGIQMRAPDVLATIGGKGDCEYSLKDGSIFIRSLELGYSNPIIDIPNMLPPSMLPKVDIVEQQDDEVINYESHEEQIQAKIDIIQHDVIKNPPMKVYRAVVQAAEKADKKLATLKEIAADRAKAKTETQQSVKRVYTETKQELTAKEAEKCDQKKKLRDSGDLSRTTTSAQRSNMIVDMPGTPAPGRSALDNGAKPGGGLVGAGR